jgi:hypothetical protein
MRSQAVTSAAEVREIFCSMLTVGMLQNPRSGPDRARKHEASEVFKGRVLSGNLKKNLVLTALRPLYPQYPAFLSLDQFSDSKEYQLEQFKQDALLIKFTPAFPIPIKVVGTVTHKFTSYLVEASGAISALSFCKSENQIKTNYLSCDRRNVRA